MTSEIGKLEEAYEYLGKLSGIVDGSVRKTKDPVQWYIVKNGNQYPSAMDILNKSEDWLDLIAEYRAQINNNA